MAWLGFCPLAGASEQSILGYCFRAFLSDVKGLIVPKDVAMYQEAIGDGSHTVGLYGRLGWLGWRYRWEISQSNPLFPSAPDSFFKQLGWERKHQRRMVMDLARAAPVVYGLKVPLRGNWDSYENHLSPKMLMEILQRGEIPFPTTRNPDLGVMGYSLWDYFMWVYPAWFLLPPEALSWMRQRGELLQRLHKVSDSGKLPRKLSLLLVQWNRQLYEAWRKDLVSLTAALYETDFENFWSLWNQAVGNIANFPDLKNRSSLVQALLIKGRASHSLIFQLMSELGATELDEAPEPSRSFAKGLWESWYGKGVVRVRSRNGMQRLAGGAESAN